MKYELIFSPRSLEDLQRLKKSGDKARLNKLQQMLLELIEHPFTGTGKPEKLRHLDNTYSRRLSSKDRLVYSVYDSTIEVHILQMIGHYDDK